MASTEIIQEELIRQQILEAATKLFQVHGFRKVAMDDVAKAIGKGRSSLYYYFKNKEEILAAVMDERIALMITTMAQAIEKTGSGEDKLYAFFSTKMKVVKEHQGSFKNMDLGMDAREMSSFNESKWSIHKRIMKEEGDLLRGIFTQGMKAGHFRKLNAAEMDTMIFVLLTSVHGVKREMVMEEDFSASEPAARMLTTLAMYGLK